MYLHIGGDVAVPFSEIISILNCETVNFADKKDNVSKSVLMTFDGKKTNVFYSDISSKALINRFECFLKGEGENVIGL